MRKTQWTGVMGLILVSGFAQGAERKFTCEAVEVTLREDTAYAWIETTRYGKPATIKGPMSEMSTSERKTYTLVNGGEAYNIQFVDGSGSGSTRTFLTLRDTYNPGVKFSYECHERK